MVSFLDLAAYIKACEKSVIIGIHMHLRVGPNLLQSRLLVWNVSVPPSASTAGAPAFTLSCPFNGRWNWSSTHEVVISVSAMCRILCQALGGATQVIGGPGLLVVELEMSGDSVL